MFFYNVTIILSFVLTSAFGFHTILRSVTPTDKQYFTVESDVIGIKMM